METTGRGRSEKLIIIIPAAGLAFTVVVVAGGPRHFLRLLNGELGQLIGMLRNWVSAWLV